MSSAHPASGGFNNVAHEYDRARPPYPRDAVLWLAAEASLGDNSAVVDVGAGTGKLSSALVDLRLDVTAIEPVAAMRDILAARLASIKVLDATADALPLPDESADAVVAGQAYHWFAGTAALEEFHRVLRPAGCLGLVWNSQDRSQELWARIGRLLDPYRGTAPRHDDGAWRASLVESDLFDDPRERRFANQQLVDRNALVERVASTSFVGALDPDERGRLLREIGAVVAAMPRQLSLRYVTEVFVYRRSARNRHGSAAHRRPTGQTRPGRG